MKKVIITTVAAALLTLFTFFLPTAPAEHTAVNPATVMCSMPVAEAQYIGWHCDSCNTLGQCAWFESPVQSIAWDRALYICRRNTHFTQACASPSCYPI